MPDISKRFELKSLIDKYPYFQAGIFIYLKSLYLAEDKTFRIELQRLFAFVTDKKALYYYVLKDVYQKFFDKKGNQKELNKSRTDILLNAFFETMNDKSIDSQIDQSVINLNVASSDYYSYLKTIENETAETTDSMISSNPMKHQNIIDNFINNANENNGIKISSDINADYSNSKIKEKSEEELSEELQEDLFFTETLANIYIKQQKYERAYEIIKRLNLNYPEKNIYFANQISFLEKLIINKKHKK